MEEIRIERLIPGGQALATLSSGKKAMFWGALPGEVVKKYRVMREKAHFVEAVAEEVGNLSEHRVAPRDEIYLATSPWQIMDFDYEMKQKAELLVESFRQAGVVVPLPLIETDGQEYFYRNKMEYSLYFNKELERIQLAFHGRGSHRKIPVMQSSLERREIWAQAEAVVGELNERGEEARKYQSLVLRCNQRGEVSGGLLEKGKPHPVFEQLEDEIMGRKYTYSPNGFFQVNLPVYEMALAEMAKWVRTEKVLDLYAGVGTISLSVARGRQVRLVECNKAAYRELERNCQVQRGLGGDLQFPQAVLAKSEEVLELIEPGVTVIVDPPRAGCERRLLERILEVEPEVVIYLSCNPATQARDVARLQSKYIISDIKGFNFFPKTPHLESLVVLNISRGK